VQFTGALLLLCGASSLRASRYSLMSGMSSVRRHLLSRRIVLTSSIALAFAAGSAWAREQTPGDFLAEVYRITGGPSGDGSDGASIFADEDNRERFLSRRLRAAIAAMLKRTRGGDAPDLDFDPISNGNDPSVHDLHIGTESKNDARAVVIADFVSHRDAVRTVLRYQLVREDGGWKIDDIVASGRNAWQVSKIIKGERAK
jgi:hypothetical protein